MSGNASDRDLQQRLAGLSPARRRLLLQRLQQEAGALGGDSRSPLAPRPRGAQAPLSWAQERLWFLSRLDPRSPLWNLAGGVRLAGRLHVPALAESLREVVRRHEALRTTFAVAGDGVVQRVAPAGELEPEVAVVDLSGLPAERRADALRTACAAAAGRGFDLEAGPLVRGLLLCEAAEEHALLVNLHHVVADGWSVAVLLRETAAAYEAFAVGRRPVLPALPVQYADFALWQREWLAGAALAAQLAYWRERLAGAPPVLDLPADRPRPPVRRGKGAIRLCRPEGAAGLRRLLATSGEGLTLFMGLLAVFAGLLARLTGERDLVIGTTIANRTRPELEGLIGYFVNSLPLRLEAGGEVSLRVLLARAREAAVGAFSHQDLPFQKLVEELRPPRDASRTPLFQVALQVHNEPKAALRLPGLEVAPLELGADTAKFDLLLSLREEAVVAGAWEYDAELFDGATIARLDGHFAALLEAAVAAPDRPVGELEILSAAERQALVVEWGGAAPRPTLAAADETLTARFARRVAADPEAEAVAFEGDRLSYGELAGRARRLAGRLVRLGVRPGDRVGLFLERSVGLVEAVLGVLEAGAAYVPLDPAYPAERVRFVLEDAGVSLVLASAETVGKLPGEDGGAFRVVLVGDDGGGRARDRAEAPLGAGVEKRLGGAGAGCLPAYVIYTSGSTGRPKGVVVSHAQVLRLFDATEEWFGFGVEDVWTLFHSYAFDFSVWELWGALLYGGRLEVVPYWVSRSPEAFLRLLRERGVTVLNQTPSAFKPLLAALAESGGDGVSLRSVVFGGEGLEPASLASWWDLPAAGGACLINMYGITETTVHVTWRPLRREDTASVIGVPIPDLQVVVAGPDGIPMPMGVAGELLVGGAGVAQGYLGRPELTAERFVPDGFSDEAGARLYRSGDLGRWTARGDLEHLGRIDQQVKVRGFRIELGEIETALVAHPAVRAAAVVLCEDTPGVRSLVAGVVGAATAAELRSWAAARLPEYMIPAAFVTVEALPMTPSGKLDRRALEALVRTAPAEPERGYVAPATVLEETVAAAFCEVLRREGIGAEGSFFELGGDSIRAAVLANRLQERLGLEVPLVEVFQAPTVADLAARLGELHASTREAPVAVVEPSSQQGPPARGRGGQGVRVPASEPEAVPAPLSWAQERLWFLEQLEPGLAAYNMPAVLRLTGVLDPAVLAVVFAEISARHTVLRSRFEERPTGPVQVAAPAGPVPLPLVDLGGVAGGEELLRLAAAEAARPFDLGRGPLLRLVLVRRAAAEHALLLTLHHTAGDGWSFGVLLREAATLYRAFAAGEASPLPPLPVQYGDYARWQRRTLDEAALAPLVAQWRVRLAGVEDLELPADRSRPAAPAPAARHHRAELSAGSAAALARMGRESGATLFLTLLAAAQALFARLSGQARFAVGSPSANRPRAELEGLVGLFVNMLPIPADLADDPSFGGLVARVRESALAAFAGQAVPFERLVQELRPRRAAGKNPLFQATFQLYPAEEAEASLAAGELAIARVETAAGATRFDLELSAAEPVAGGALGLGLVSSAALFDGATARRLLQHFETLLTGAAANPQRPVSALPLLAAAEIFQLAVEWNDTGSSYPAECGVHQLFAAQAAARPEAVAVSWGPAGELRYGALADQAGRIAAALAAAGVRPGDVVALAAGRGAERVVGLAAGLVGILAAGAAYLPLDPEEPAERLRFQLADSGAAALVAGSAEVARLAGLLDGIPVVSIDPAIAPAPLAGIGKVGGGDLAYVMYTSGSTGRPKGVAVPHRAIARLVLEAAYCPLGPDDRIPQLAHPAFDALTFEVWGALLHGARLVGVAREVVLDPRALAHELAGQGITALFVTTALFQQMALEAPDAFRGVRTLMMGGELLRPERARAVLAAGGPERLLHVYGPTESTTFATWERVRAVPVGAATVPIGRPLDRTRLQVLDRALRPVPAGVAGELCIGGDGLALGYWRRPELTAERFVPDPLGGPGERLYRTGDRVRRLADGRIDFLGRFDHQVKVRGFRIEPGEVESALGLHPAVREALVQAVENPASGDRRLAAWVVLREGAAVEDGELAAFLRERLPAPMVPSAWMRLAAWPLTPSGKIDRRALPAPERAAAGGAPPSGLLEEAVAAFCAELLGLPAVGAEDDFFELGGHSLLATQLVSRMRGELGVDLPLRVVFEAPTVRGLAAAVAEIRAASAGAEAQLAAPPLVPQPRDGALPLSFAQERLWFLDRLAPGNPFYNMPAVVRMTGDLAVPALAGALAAVSARHEAVRTRFPERAGRPVQEVGPMGWPLPLIDLVGLPEVAGRIEADRLTGEDARLPFDLARGPVVRARLVRLGAGEHLLLLNLHHIVADGWSFGVLVGEVAALYPALVVGRPVALPPLPIQLPDFAVWQRGWLTGAVWERQMAYWRELLAGLPASLSLPTDRPRPALQRFRGERVRAALAPALREGLAGLAREAGGTLFMPLLAAFGALVARHAGQVDLAVGSPIANRNRSEIEGLIGFFVNALVLRLDLSGAPGFREVVARAREVALGAYAHQDLPFEKLVEELQPQRDMSRNPLFQVVLALQNAPMPPVELPGVRLEPLRLQDETAKFDLKLDLWEGVAGLTGAWQFDTDLFDAPTVARFGEHFRALVEAGVAEPDRPVGELGILSAAERQALVVEWNGAVEARRSLAAADETLTARFARRVAADPGAAAVAFEGERVSYGELAGRARRLAGRLVGLGVRPGDRVGLFLERSVGLVEAVLGVLGAGAAYVPLDPAYPAERVRFVLEDAGVSLVLASAETVGKLPGEGGGAFRVVLLGDDGEGWERDRAGAPLGTGVEKRLGGAGAGCLPAYVIYTSGSTGRPKGVVVSHAQVLRLFDATEDWFGFGAADVWTLFHSYAFDFSVWELWGALLYGGRLEVVPYWVSRSPEAFLRLLRERGVTVLNQTPSAFKPLLAALAESGGDGVSLRSVVFGGEGLEPASLATWWDLPAAGGACLINMYGITETTVHVTWRPLRQEDTASVIGVPIPDLRVVVAGPDGRPVPMGVAGELLVGGAGVAQGYLGRPELTAERFVPDGFSGEAGARLYRSGDLGRWTARGDLEHLGRIDQQVKVRGFRIELGEVEAALVAHPAVRAAAVVLREDVPGERALAAYVVAAAEEEGEGWQGGQVESWRQVFDDTYGTGSGALEETFDITGWTSAATGEAIPAAEMAEWLEDTVAAIRRLAPRRVLEIGCGTGLVLFRVAPGCETYVGTDFSATVLADLRAKLDRPELVIPGVRLEQRAADDFAGMAAGSFDLVVINSVAQYLPSAEYLERVLAGAVAAVAPGGAVFVGDVRSLPLLRAFQAGVELERAEGELSVAQLEVRVRQQVAQETELVLAPEFFAAVARRLARVSAVEVFPKTGRAENELTRFRYQVVLRVAGAPAGGGAAVLDWQGERLDLPALRGLLADARPAGLVLRGIPNSRLVREAALLRLLAAAPPATPVSALREGLAVELAEGTSGGTMGVHPDDLAGLAEGLGYRVRLGWAEPGEDGRFDALLVRGDVDPTGFALPVLAVPELPPAAFASRPREGLFARRVAPELRRHLRERLPDYMVPAALVLLDRLPLTPEGKLDRRALPAPDRGRQAAGTTYVAPRTPLEETLAAVWAGVLGLERVGVEDDFFQLGGHSLLATQVVSRLREGLGVEVPLRRLFEAPTVAALARALEADRGLPAGAPPLSRAPRDRPLPLSFAQERIWFLDRLAPGGNAYNEPLAVALAGPLDAAALARAFGEVARRHEALRTVFPEVDGRPVQVIGPPVDAGEPMLPLADLSSLPGAVRAAETARLQAAQVRRSFDLARGPLLSALLVRLGPAEHRLAVALQHIVFDGWSTGVLARELSALYGAFAGGRPSPLPAPPLQVADFASWQRNWLQGEVLAAELAWWRERLAGAADLALPADRPRSAAPAAKGAIGLSLPAGLAGRLRELGRERGATLFMVLLAAFQTLLGRLAGQADVVVGSPVANRDRAELEGVLGFFVNMLVLRADLSGDPAFETALARVREAALGAYEHQHLPFERLVDELQPRREAGRNPLFQVVFQLLNTPRPELVLPGVVVRPLAAVAGAAKFDLDLSLVEGGGAVAGTLDFHRGLFDGATARRLAGAFVRLLEAAAVDPAAPLSRLPLLDAAERHQLLAEWNDRPGRRPPAVSLYRLFAQQATARPEALAVTVAGAPAAALTYRALERWAARLDKRLRAAGVGPGTPVGIALERSPALIAALLGVLRAGGVYVPLDPALPAARLAAMSADAGVRLAVVAETGAARVEEWGLVPVLLPERPAEPGSGEEPDSPPIEVPPIEVPADALAYVLFTSGSTGRPKGVGVPHRAVHRLVVGADWADFGPELVFLQAAPASFDASTLEIWAPLVHGGRLAVLPSARPSLAELGAAVAAEGVDALWLTAGLFRQVAEGDLQPYAGVRQLFAGGDVLPPAQVERVLRELPGCRLVNGYGPTENTTFTCCHAIALGGRLRPSVPIGRPIAGSWIRVLEPFADGFAPVPIGVAGELCAGGDGLARGYVGRPDLTAERFVPDPEGEPGARLYRSGDRVRLLADGTVEFLGRLDAQVKVRGFRIEAAEVEAALGRHPAVAGAAVGARADGLGEKRLVAWVVARAGLAAPPGAGELRAFLAGLLPEPMIPSAFVEVTALPLAATGKVDRAALPDATPAAAAAAPAAFRTPLEEIVAGVWQEVLGVAAVGPEDDFFDLGGHSLLATRVVARLRRVLGVEMPLGDLFAEPTVAALARRAGELLATASGRLAPPLVPLPPAARGGDLPLSFAQERLWFLDQLVPDNPFYNVPCALRLRGPLAVSALAAALDGVVARHEALRTAFAEVAGRPLQRIAPAAGCPLPLVDLAGLPAETAGPVALALASAEALRPFDLARAPQLRGLLLRLPDSGGEREHALVLTAHHVASDGWSTGVLIREVAALYGAAVAGRPSPLPPLPVQYADFAVWQRGWLVGEALESQLAWWRGALGGGLPTLELPADRPRPAFPAFRGGTVEVGFAPPLGRPLRRLARDTGATPFMALLAAWAALLQRFSGQTDFAIGTPVANRTRAEVEGLIGFFVNTLALRVRPAPELSFRTLVERVRETALGAFAHQDLPFERLVEELRPERDPSRTPLFQVMFALQNVPLPALVPAGGLTLSPWELERRVALFDLTLDLSERGEGFAGLLEHDADLFERATMRRLGGQLAALLAGAVADPEQPFGELPLLSAAERHQVRVEWNDTARTPVSGTLAALLRGRAAASPEAPAAVFEGEELSYGELVRRGEVLAGRLRALGVGPEVRVAILLERSLELPVAIAGALLAGGAYVPLDPDYPAERLGWILVDSAAPVVVTRARLLDRLPLAAARAVVLDAGWAEGEGGVPGGPGERVPPLVEPLPENAAYVLYTSGSTGRPKGSVIAHHSVMAYCAATVERLDLGPGDRILQFVSPGFDVMVGELFPTWMAGGTVVLCRPERLAEPAEFLRVVEAERLTGFELPTAYWHDWVDALIAAGSRLPAHLRFVATGTERVSRGRLAAWSGLGADLVHVFGLTETTVTSALHVQPAGQRWTEAGPLPIGRPLPEVGLYLLDGAGRPVGIGVRGEVSVGGIGVGRGYWERPDLTAERFVPDGVSGGRGARLYRTGDAARLRPDGELEFLGRLDRQLKVRGYRIEPGEIEAALEAHPGVREAVVELSRERGLERLVGYVVASNGSPPAAAELKTWLRARLPEYMVPAAWVALAALPLTAHGKVDRGALPAPEAKEGAVAPRSPVEETLAAILAEVLGLERVGVTDDFFELGGHSLLAAQVIARVRAAFGVEVPLRRLFESPTVAALALEVVGLQVAADEGGELAGLLAELEGLSDEETRALLEQG